MQAIVVDDSSAMRRIEERALTALGWQVRSAPDGRQALGLLGQTQDCALLVTDWHMPEMDGLELVKAVRGDARFARLRILMVTSESVVGAIQQALDAGANDIVMKPFSQEAFAERIAEVMHG